jgi:hypothetical protein
VPAEITTYCFYPGLQKDYMVANAIFRMGGAAIMLSNMPRYGATAKYQLLHNVRTHQGADDASYSCMGWGPDKDGINGVYLRRDVPIQAAKALEVCLRAVAPRILTWRQYAEAAANLIQKRVLGWQVPEYIPDFTQCVDHFALHAGGYAVLKGLQSAMRLPSEKMLPSFATLRDFGNTSCSTTWYVLAYMETCVGINRGQTIMQIGMGGGMKVRGAGGSGARGAAGCGGGGTRGQGSGCGSGRRLQRRAAAAVVCAAPDPPLPTAPNPTPPPLPQAGVNIWRALRDVRAIHPAWRHVAHCPITEADLPRPISDPNAPINWVPAGDIAAAVKASFSADFKHAVAKAPSDGSAAEGAKQAAAQAPAAVAAH